MRQLKLSHSALETFNDCNFKYSLKHKKYIKPYIPIRWPLVSGVAFHELANKMYQECNFDRKFLIHYWKSIFMNALDTEGSAFANTDGYEKYLNAGYILINKFWSFANNNGYLVKPIKAEWKFDISRGPFLITGKTDLIIQRSESSPVEILDFKTSWKVPTKENVRKNKQLTLYDWAVKTVFNLPNRVVGLFFPRKDVIIPSERTEDDHNTLLGEFSSMYQTILSGPLQPNYEHCENCEYTQHCPFFKINTV